MLHIKKRSIQRFFRMLLSFEHVRKKMDAKLLEGFYYISHIQSCMMCGKVDISIVFYRMRLFLQRKVNYIHSRYVVKI